MTNQHSKVVIMGSHQGRIQDLWKGGGGAAAVPFEDPLWNFKGGGAQGACALFGPP